ncbi:MAG TPA: hypothetical protein VG815_11485 [Chloroflexota bacterium]|nr:hypothetical protein [Chloroflexota bacterium]
MPDDVHKTLKTRAAAAGLSLSAYLLGEVKRVSERAPIADVQARAARRPEGVSLEDAVEAVPSGRDRG